MSNLLFGVRRELMRAIISLAKARITTLSTGAGIARLSSARLEVLIQFFPPG